MGAHVGVDISPKSVEKASQLGCYTGGVFVGSLEEELKQEVIGKGPFDAVIIVGTLSYVTRFDLLWKDCLRVLKPGGLMVATHRSDLWDADVDSVQTEAAKRVISGEWKLEVVTEPMAYMPKNPDPEENAKRIKYLVFRKNAQE